MNNHEMQVIEGAAGTSSGSSCAGSQHVKGKQQNRSGLNCAMEFLPLR